ncbi:hypothetical protein SAMN05444006_106158 [Allgaiera indica]|uniref:Uncharacterized protein n=1 Tax=Allgaiera indica TaxID=765699 RepID=A0A1H2W4B6_9RHOB|nr:hypothetical protein SAMN05444006_106158 [Allgaiera indica]
MRDVSSATVDLRDGLVGEHDRKAIFPNFREGLGQDADGPVSLELVQDHPRYSTLVKGQTGSFHTCASLRCRRANRRARAASAPTNDQHGCPRPPLLALPRGPQLRSEPRPCRVVRGADRGRPDDRHRLLRIGRLSHPGTHRCPTAARRWGLRWGARKPGAGEGFPHGRRSPAVWTSRPGSICGTYVVKKRWRRPRSRAGSCSCGRDQRWSRLFPGLRG